MPHAVVVTRCKGAYRALQVAGIVCFTKDGVWTVPTLRHNVFNT